MITRQTYAPGFKRPDFNDVSCRQSLTEFFFGAEHYVITMTHGPKLPATQIYPVQKFPGKFGIKSRVGGDGEGVGLRLGQKKKRISRPNRATTASD